MEGMVRAMALTFGDLARAAAVQGVGQDLAWVRLRPMSITGAAPGPPPPRIVALPPPRADRSQLAPTGRESSACVPLLAAPPRRRASPRRPAKRNLGRLFLGLLGVLVCVVRRGSQWFFAAALRLRLGVNRKVSVPANTLRPHQQHAHPLPRSSAARPPSPPAARPPWPWRLPPPLELCLPTALAGRRAVRGMGGV